MKNKLEYESYLLNAKSLIRNDKLSVKDLEKSFKVVSNNILKLKSEILKNVVKGESVWVDNHNKENYESILKAIEYCLYNYNLIKEGEDKEYDEQETS